MKHLLNDLQDVVSILNRAEQGDITAEDWNDLVSENLLDDIANLCEIIFNDFTGLNDYFESIEK